MPSSQPSSSSQPPSLSRPISSSQPTSSNQPGSSICADTSKIRKVQAFRNFNQPPPTPIVSNAAASTNLGISRGRGISGQKRGPTNATRGGQKRSNNVGFGLYYDNRTGIQILNPGTSSERVVTAGSNVKSTAPTNIDICFKPPCLRWKGTEFITTFQLQQMRDSRRN